MTKLKQVEKFATKFVLANALTWLIGGVFVLVGFAMIPLHFEYDPFASGAPVDGLRAAIFWVTFWAALLSIGFIFLSKRFKMLSGPVFRRTFLVYTVLGIALGLSFVGLINERISPSVAVDTGPKITDIDIYELWMDTNDLRQAVGLGKLSLNPDLNESAALKCNDMIAKDYWDHNTPEGKEPWVFFRQMNIEYKSAGENLAFGYRNSAETVINWMNSPTHKDNILSPKYEEVGFAVCISDNFIGQGTQLVVVQHFLED